jgi:molybdopterin-guanine dinucleotide biosynthesis protein A
MKRAGFVLVGGKSSRMGGDKALLPYQGRTLVEHIAQAVRDAAGSATLIGPPERYRALGFPVVADIIEDRGPLGGILTALTVSPAEWNLVVACGMPALNAPFLLSLFSAAEESGGHCLIPCSTAGRPEPLCAVYHRGCLAGVREAIDAGRLTVRDALAGLNAVYHPVPGTAWSENLNTPKDWAIHTEAPGPVQTAARKGNV